MPINIRRTIIGKIAHVVVDPYAANKNVIAMTDAPGYRLRVGDYRVVYSLDDAMRIMFVEKTGPRGSVYDD